MVQRREGTRGRTGSRTASTRPGAGRDRKEPAQAVYPLTELEQIKVLADPLRIRILELLCEERTTKQVAEILGQPPTRLYHHVAALDRVGLIRLSRTRQNRGALEKYYLAVAGAFSVDSRLFTSAAGAQAREATQGMAAQLLENTIADLDALLSSGQSIEVLEKGGVLSYLEVRGSPRELKAIRNRLMRLLKGITTSKGKGGAAGQAYRLTIAFFPLAGRSGPTRSGARRAESPSTDRR